MGTVNLSDLSITPLRRIKTDGGDVLHAMKKLDPSFVGFGEAYFSWVAAGAIKGWKRHTSMTMNLVVPVGQVRFVFCRLDQHGETAVRVEEIGEARYVRATVPPGIWFAFQGLGAPQSLILNISNIPHDPNEVERLALDDIEYFWS
jgi:dTDP-4-dehydrorhamnose 3,5-epimerase